MQFVGGLHTMRLFYLLVCVVFADARKRRPKRTRAPAPPTLPLTLPPPSELQILAARDYAEAANSSLPAWERAQALVDAVYYQAVAEEEEE